MNQPPDDLTQPLPAEPTAEQAAVPAVDAARPAGVHSGSGDAVPPSAAADAAAPEWARATPAGEAPASHGAVPSPAPAAYPGYGVPAASGAAPGAPRSSWRARVSGGRGLAVGALVVGLGLGAVGGSVVTWAAVHDSGSGAVADGRGFDRDSGFGRPDGDRGGFPPGGGQRPGGDQDGDQLPGNGGSLPGGGTGGTGGNGGSNDSSGSGTDANGTSQAT